MKSKMSCEASSCDEKHGAPWLTPLLHSAIPMEHASPLPERRGPAKSFKVLGGFLIALSLLTIGWHVGLHFTSNTVLACFLIPSACGGVLLLVTGIVAVVAGAKKSPHMAVATLVLAIIAIMVNFGILGFGSVQIAVSRAIDGMDDEYDQLYDTYDDTPDMTNDVYDYIAQPASTGYPHGYPDETPGWNRPLPYKTNGVVDDFISVRRKRQATTTTSSPFYNQLFGDDTTTPGSWDGWATSPTTRAMDWFTWAVTTSAPTTTTFNWDNNAVDSDPWWYERNWTTGHPPRPRPSPRPHPPPGPHPGPRPHHHHHHHPHDGAFRAHLALSIMTVVTSVLCFAMLLAISICSCRKLCVSKHPGVVVYALPAHMMASNVMGMPEATHIHCEPGEAAVLGDEQAPPSYACCEKTLVV